MFYILDGIERSYFFTVRFYQFVLHRTSTILRLWTGNRTWRSIWVSGYWPFHMLFLGSVYLFICNRCSGRPEGIGRQACTTFTSSENATCLVFYFQGVNYTVVDSWIGHFEIFLPAALQFRGHEDGFHDILISDRIWPLIRSYVIAFSLTSFKGL